MPDVIGEAFVAIRPETTGFANDLKTSVGTAATQAGDQATGVFDRATSKIGRGFSGLVGVLQTQFGLPFVGILDTVGQKLDTMTAKGSSFAESLASVGKGVAIAGVVAVTAVVAESIHVFDSYEQAHARLEGAIHNVGDSFDREAPKIAAVNKQLEQLGFTNTQTESALATLTRAAGSTEKALALMGLAADLARARNIDLESATSILSKVMTGHVALLGRYGIATKDAAGNTLSVSEAVQALSDKFGGQAQRSADTFTGRVQVLKAEMQDIGIKIGELVLPVLEKLGSAFAVTAQFFVENKVAALALAVVIGGPLVAALTAYLALKVGSVIAFWADAFDKFAGVIMTTVIPALSELTAAQALAALGMVAIPLAIAGVVAGAIVLIGSLSSISDHLKQLATDQGKFVTDTLAASRSAQSTADGINILKLALVDQGAKLKSLNTEWDRGKTSFANGAFSFAILGGASKALQTELAKLEAQQKLNEAADRAQNVELGKITAGTESFYVATQKARDAVTGLTDALLASTDSDAAYQQSLVDVQTAQDALTKAIQDYGANSPEAAKAAQDLADANRHSADAAVANDKAHADLFATLNVGGQAAYDAQNKRLDDLEAKYPANIANLEAERQTLKDTWWYVTHTPGSLDFVFDAKTTPGFDAAVTQLTALLNATNPDGTPAFNLPVPLGFRASGGPVGEGDYVVGERGNGGEILHLNAGSSGFVTNAAQTDQMMGSGGDHYEITIHNLNRSDITDSAVELVKRHRLAQALR